MTDNAKHFDNCGVVFVSGWYKTEGDSPCKDYNDANGLHGYCQHDVCIAFLCVLSQCLVVIHIGGMYICVTVAN